MWHKESEEYRAVAALAESIYRHYEEKSRSADQFEAYAYRLRLRLMISKPILRARSGKIPKCSRTTKV